MANKWMRKLGIGMSVIMAVSQLSTGMVLAAPEEVFDEDVEIEEEVFEDSEDGFGDILAEKYEAESENEEQTVGIHTVEGEELFDMDAENETEVEDVELYFNPYTADSNDDGIFTAEEIDAKLTSLRAYYINGRYWNHYGIDDGVFGVTANPCPVNRGTHNSSNYDTYGLDSYCNHYGNASQCLGFARLISAELFGTIADKSSDWIDVTGDNLTVGDFVWDYSIPHGFIITAVNDNSIRVVECNWYENCQISWTRDITRSSYFDGSRRLQIRHHKNNMYNQSVDPIVPKEYTPFDIARIAEGEVGTVGGSKYSSNSGGWAAYFANWCYRTAGADTTTWPEYANITKFIEYFQGQGRYHDKVSYSWSYKEYSGGGKVDNYIPQWGDFVVIEANGNDADGPDTGGIVTSRSAYEDRITIAVGNQDDKVVSYNYKMSTGYPMDGSTSTHIVGVCNPDFKGNFINGTVEKVEAGAGTIHVKGWTFDYDDLSVSLPVYVYVGGKYDSGASRYDIVADIERPDVNAKYGITGAHGFDATIKVAERGTQEVWIHSNDIGTKAFGGINLGSNTGFSVNVTDQIEKINVSGVSMDIFGADLQVGVDQRIYATVSPSNAEDKTLVWKTSDENVVIVDQKGNFTTIAPGKAIITVTATNGTSDTADDVSATCIITVFEDKPDPTTTPDPTGTEKPTVTPEPTGTEEPTIPPTPTGSENTSAKIAVTNITDNDATITVQLNEIQNVSNVFVNVWQGASYWNSDNVCYEFYDVNKATDYFSFNISDIDAKLEPGKQYGVTLSIYCDSGYIMPDDVTFTTTSTHSSDPTPTPKDPDSTPRLEVGTDGQTHCYVNGVENDFYNGLALYNDGTGDRFVYAAYGKMDTTKMGFTDYEGGKFLIVKGEIETGANGLVQDIDNPSDWYYCANGQVQSQYTGLAFYDGEWFYINRGKLNTILTAYVSYDGGLFYVAAGRIVKEVNGLAKDPNGKDWYYLANGQAQTQYTGLAQYDGAWFYVVKGKLAENYTGQVKYDGAIFNVVNGMLK